MRIIKNSEQRGFTIVELLIATTVFSVILLAASATLIQIGRMYYKGVISSKTQGVARSTIDSVARGLQFTSGDFTPSALASASGPDQFAVCYGSTRFTYVKLMQLKSSPAGPNQIKHVLWEDSAPLDDCLSGAPDLTQDTPSPGGRELLGENMRLKDFSISQVGSDDKFNVVVSVIYGDDDLLHPDATNPESCKGSLIGGQWCAFSKLSTQVYRRVK